MENCKKDSSTETHFKSSKTSTGSYLDLDMQFYFEMDAMNILDNPGKSICSDTVPKAYIKYKVFYRQIRLQPAYLQEKFI